MAYGRGRNLRLKRDLFEDRWIWNEILGIVLEGLAFDWWERDLDFLISLIDALVLVTIGWLFDLR